MSRVTKTKNNDDILNLNRTVSKSVANFKPPENLTVTEWANKYRRLSAENSAEAGRWKTSRTPYLEEIMNAFTDAKIHRIAVAASSQVGKALDIDTPIPTPTGWTTMGDLMIGDKVFDENGSICNVTFATEHMYNRKCYKITFSDGSSIVADAEHRWYVESDLPLEYPNGLNRKAVYNGVLTTEQIKNTYKYGLKERNRYAIPVVKPIECQEIELPIAPYTLGVWLGDGHSYSTYFCGHLDDYEIVENVRKDGYKVKVVEKESRNYEALIEPKEKSPICRHGHDTRITGVNKYGRCLICSREWAMKHKWKDSSYVSPITEPLTFGMKMRNLGLIGNKHIPQQYLRASVEQRFELLKGLMDTDGSISTKGRCEITLKSKQLIDDVSELLHSLGIKHTLKEKKTVCTNSVYQSTGIAYRISFLVYDDTPVFKLKRKLNRMVCRTGRRTTETERRRIVSVEEVSTRPVRCIQVDSPNHLYLAGKAMIPTHNTEMEMNMMGYVIDNDPGPIMFVMPTVDNARDFSKRRIAPMIRDTKNLRDKVGSAKSRDGDNTVLKKSYPGGMLTLTGSNSPASLASVPARYVFGDERDRWAKDAGGEGDPWGLVEARTITFYNYKMVEVSTPTIKGYSAIESSFALGTQEYWCVECPHCHEYHFIEFDNIKFEHHSTKINNKHHYIVDNAEYVCPECGCISSESTMKKQPHKWIAKNPDAYKNGVRSFWINAFSSPWMTWKTLVLRFLEAKDDPEKLKTVYNTLFGKLWEDRGDLEDEDGMLERREEYEAELPEGCLCLTCGVDTQDNRLEYEVVGYGFHEENWGIEKGIINGKPSENETWEKLDYILDRPWRFKDGKALKISLTFVDSGGHYTQEVYEQCKRRTAKRVFAIKGKGGEGVPFTGPPSKVNIVKDNKVVDKTWIYIIGVDAGKERIMSGLKVREGARRSHFPLDEARGYDALFFHGLLSEKMELSSQNKWVWKKLPGHERNEALDCRNYANAAFRALKPNLYAIFARLKGVVTEEKPKPVKKQQRKRKLYDEW